MQFAKLLLPPQLSPPHAPNALTSSPTKQRDNRPEHLFDGPHHLRTHSSAALPP